MASILYRIGRGKATYLPSFICTHIIEFAKKKGTMLIVTT